MCTRADCMRSMGQWVRFQTPWGIHRGIVMDVNQRAVLMRVPRQYAPVGLVKSAQSEGQSDEQRLDLALAQYGYGRHGYGRGWGYPGYYGWWGGWWWWWLAFAWIFALAFLW